MSIFNFWNCHHYKNEIVNITTWVLHYLNFKSCLDGVAGYNYSVHMQDTTTVYMYTVFASCNKTLRCVFWYTVVSHLVVVAYYTNRIWNQGNQEVVILTLSFLQWHSGVNTIKVPSELFWILMWRSHQSSYPRESHRNRTGQWQQKVLLDTTDGAWSVCHHWMLRSCSKLRPRSAEFWSCLKLPCQTGQQLRRSHACCQLHALHSSEVWAPTIFELSHEQHLLHFVQPAHGSSESHLLSLFHKKGSDIFIILKKKENQWSRWKKI